MKALLLFPDYVRWHYGHALVSFVVIIRNLMWFCVHLFSIKLLLATLFSPWEKVQVERESQEFKFTEIIFNFLTNMLLRLAGAMIRLSVIGVGMIIVIVIFCCGTLLFILWLLFPLTIVCSFILGIIFFFK